MDPGARIGLAEVRAPAAVTSGSGGADAADRLAPFVDSALAISPDVTPFVELPRGDGWERGVEHAVAALAGLRTARLRALGAKLRTGGLEPAAFPTPDEVAVFIVACARHEIPFKVTAGLHHPVRHHDDELDVDRHGFLNIALAAALATAGAGTDTVAAAVAESDVAAISIGAASLRWRDHQIPVPAIRRMRSHLFPSYGSCSFDEPVDDLIRMEILGGTTSLGEPAGMT